MHGGTSVPVRVAGRFLTIGIILLEKSDEPVLVLVMLDELLGRRVFP